MDYSTPFLFVVNDNPDTWDPIRSLASLLQIQFAAFSSTETFLNRFTQSMAGCLLVDLHLKNMSGLEFQDALAARGSILPVIFASDSRDLATVVRVMKNGALTVIPMPFQAEELAEAVRRGLEINMEARQLAARHAEVRRRLALLTAQERRVLEMIIEGTPNKRITRVFGVSQRTIARVARRIYEKMCVESAFELARVVANLAELPAVGGQERSLIRGREFRTHVSGECITGVSLESDGRQTALPPPHFQHEERRMISRKSEREYN